MKWETILCLGDSITFGARSYLGFPEYCAAALELATNKNWNVINRSKSGFTTIDLHRYLDNFSPTFYTCPPQVINIMIGTNDLKKPTSLSDFEIAYKALIVKIQANYPKSHLILNEIPPLLSGVSLPYKMSMNETILAFNDIINKLATKMEIDMLKFEFDPSYMFDGVHLNNYGSKKIGELLAKKIISMRE